MSKLILFDCDGTLTDSNGVIVQAMQQAFDDYGILKPDSSAILAALGMSLDGVVELLLHQQQAYAKALAAQIAQAYREHYCATESSVCLYPGVLDVLAELKARGYWMAIVTGKSKSGLQRVIRQFGLQHYFYAWRTADCCYSKPHPAMALECMAELGMHPDDTCLVGDSCVDMQLAKAAGVRAIGAAFGAEDKQRLYDEGAEKVLNCFEELLDMFPVLEQGLCEPVNLVENSCGVGI